MSLYYKDGIEASAKTCLAELYNLSLNINFILAMKKIWYEKGCSKKEALKNVVIDNSIPGVEVFERWDKRCKKYHPLLAEGIWDGGDDRNSCSISYMKTHYYSPEKTCIEITLSDEDRIIDVDKMVGFVKGLVNSKRSAYSFIHNNGYWFNDRNVFPDRAYVGWMIHIPAVVLAELIPEAARVVPVMDEEGKQKGTIIVSTEEVFDGSKKEHIEKSNDIEIRLLDLGLLPLMTEL